MRHLGILFISVVFGVITPLTVTAGPGNGAGQLASSVGCQPDGSPKDDDIICTGITPVAVEAGKGNDQVDIQTGATVSTEHLAREIISRVVPRPKSTRSVCTICSVAVYATCSVAECTTISVAEHRTTELVCTNTSTMAKSISK